MGGIIWSQDGEFWDHGQFFSLDKTALRIWVRLPQTSFSYTANTHCSSKPIYRIPGYLVFSECTSKWPFYWSQHSLTKSVVNFTEAQHVVKSRSTFFFCLMSWTQTLRCLFLYLNHESLISHLSILSLYYTRSTKWCFRKMMLTSLPSLQLQSEKKLSFWWVSWRIPGIPSLRSQRLEDLSQARI